MLGLSLSIGFLISAFFESGLSMHERGILFIASGIFYVGFELYMTWTTLHNNRRKENEGNKTEV